MKRIITSIRKANKDVLRAISLEYPKGVDDDDLVSLPTSTGANIRALEIELEDCMYLVKMDDESFYQRFLAKDEDFDEDDDDDSDEDDIDDDIDADTSELELDALDEDSDSA